MFTFQTLSSSLGLSVLKAPKDGIRTRNQRGRSLVWKSPRLKSTASLLSSLLPPDPLFLLCLFGLFLVLITSSQTLSMGLGQHQSLPPIRVVLLPLNSLKLSSSPKKQTPKHAQSSEFLCKTKQNPCSAPRSARALKCKLGICLAFGTRLCFVLPFLPPSHCLLFMPFFLMSWIFFPLKKVFQVTSK